MKKLPLAAIMALTVTACTQTAPHQDTPHARIVPLYAFMRDYNSLDQKQITDILKRDSIEINAFMQTVTEMPPSRQTIQTWAASDPVKIFTPTVDSVFSDTATIGKTLAHILNQAKLLNLNLPDRRYATVVHSRPQSILFVDSIMLIALNHYLGQDYPGYSHWPAYIRAHKTPQNLPYDITEALIATQNPYTNTQTQTALSHMLYHGAITYIKTLLVPNSTPWQALGYTQQQYDFLIQNEAKIWHSIISQQLLYDTSNTTIDRLVAPAPAVNIVSPQTPGQAGRFIGYRIVQQWIEKHPDTPIQTLLTPQFYNSTNTLIQAAYSPQ